MKKIKRIRPNMSFAEAAAKLGISDSTVLRLVQRGTLHATKPQMWRHHWTRFILEDEAFKDELARRRHGIKAPRREPAAPQEKNPQAQVPKIIVKKIPAQQHNQNQADADESWWLHDLPVLADPAELKMQRLAAKVEQAANAAIQAKSSEYKAGVSALDASQKEEQCSLHVEHSSEWCNKAQKAYIACAEERRGSLRCAAWCTLACIVAALILIANLFA